MKVKAAAMLGTSVRVIGSNCDLRTDDEKHQDKDPWVQEILKSMLVAKAKPQRPNFGKPR